MLVVSRKLNEVITISPADYASPENSWNVQAEGKIEITVSEISANRVRLKIAAPAAFRVIRGRMAPSEPIGVDTDQQ